MGLGVVLWNLRNLRCHGQLGGEVKSGESSREAETMPSGMFGQPGSSHSLLAQCAVGTEEPGLAPVL